MDEHEQMTITPEKPELSQEAKQWAMLSHLAAFAVFVFPFGNIIAPLLVWQLKKDLDPYVEHNGKEAVNFQITIALVMLLCMLMMFYWIGFLLLLAVGLYWLVITIVAGIKANNGEGYRYPWTIRFIK